MARRATYTVCFRETQWGDEHHIDVVASSKVEAYDIATYELIPELTGSIPYSSWTDSVTYANGRVHYFCTSEGNAY